MIKKYYAVKVGKNPGIYTTWDECKNQVDKFPGAIYKSFKTLEEAQKFAGVKYKIIKSESIESKPKATYKRKISSGPKENEIKPIRSSAKVVVFEKYVEPTSIKDDFDLVVFVDGSYDNISKTYGSGIAVINFEDESVSEYKESGYDKWDQWNIVGEIEASKYAIKLAYDNNLKKVCIYHDLKNIALWASGSWQAKNEYTQDYVRYVEKYSKDIDITFVKVKGHSANVYNDIADRLAREAIEDSQRV